MEAFAQFRHVVPVHIQCIPSEPGAHTVSVKTALALCTDMCLYAGHTHVFICFATKTTIRSQSATPFSRKTNKNQPFFHHNQRKKMRNRFDAAYTTNFHNRTMKSVGQLHVCAVKWRPINKASFCCRKKWESWIFAQTSQTPIIYSSDLFTYNAKYFQTFLGEKWHRTWLES